MAAPRPTFGAPLPGNARAASRTGGTPYRAPQAPNYAARYPGAMAAVRGAFPGGEGEHRQYVKLASHTQPPPAPAPATAPPAWPPSSLFKGQRQLEVGEAERGLHEAEREGATTRTRLGNQYATSLSENDRERAQELADYNRQSAEQNDAYQKGLGLLAESFQKLGTRQSEAANKAGVLQGGALLSSAAVRGANEAKERTKRAEANTKAIQALERGHVRAGETLDRARARLIEEEAPPDEANPVGGIKYQDLATHLANLQANTAWFGQEQQSLAGQEASEAGWPGYPPAAQPPAPARYPGAAGAVSRAFPGGTAQQRAWIKAHSRVRGR